MLIIYMKVRLLLYVKEHYNRLERNSGNLLKEGLIVRIKKRLTFKMKEWLTTRMKERLIPEDEVAQFVCLVSFDQGEVSSDCLLHNVLKPIEFSNL